MLPGTFLLYVVMTHAPGIMNRTWQMPGMTAEPTEDTHIREANSRKAKLENPFRISREKKSLATKISFDLNK